MTEKRGFELTDEQKQMAAGLTKLQLNTALQYVRGGMSQREAYLAAGGKAKTENAQKSSASEILTNPDVQAFCESLKESTVKSTIMDREEAMNILSSMARTTIRDVAKFRNVEVGADDNGEPVHQSVWELKDEDEIDGEAIGSISELSAGKDGFKFKMYSRAQAIKQLSDMAGWNAPAKHEHTGKDGEAIEVKETTGSDLARRIAFLLASGVKGAE